MEGVSARNVLLHAPIAVVAFDRQGHIRCSNPAACALFGDALTGPELVSVASLIEGLGLNGDGNEAEISAFNNRNSNLGDGVHTLARRLDGTLVPVHLHAARFPAGGEPFVTLFIEDRTALVAAETALQELRVRMIHNWRLNSLGEMVSVLAHELSQPITAIANTVHGARGLLTQADFQMGGILKAAEATEVEALRAIDMIRRLKAMLSRDTGYHDSEQVAEVIGEIMPILEIKARELDADLVLDVVPTDQTACNRLQLQQMVFNLVRNAMEAPATGARRQVRISGRPLGSQAYTITVEDNGPGIAPEMKESLFDPLFSTKPDGMGLGLSICRTIAKAHRGSIESVESPLGGAAFVVSLNDSGVDEDPGPAPLSIRPSGVSRRRPRSPLQ